MSTSRAISVLGSVNIDLVVETGRLPAEGETVLGTAFRITPGGKGANQAVAAARLGGRVSFFGCVGSDEWGRLARENLGREGIDVAGLESVDDHTGVALIMVDPKGRNLICVAPGANARVRARGWHDIYLTQLETPFHLPDSAGFVILNPAPAKEVPLAGVDVVIPNEIEARQLTGERDPARAAEALVRLGARRAIITLGARGVFDGRYLPAFAVEPKDTVGAGDTFVGAFAAAVAAGDPDPVRFAQAAAALKCTRPGAQSIPARQEVLDFLSRA